MLLPKLKVNAAVLLSAGALAAAAGALSQSRNVVAQAPAEVRKDFPAPDELAKLAAVIKPAPEENKWQQIPWITDVKAGLRLAKAENRPILLVVIMGELLDEC